MDRGAFQSIGQRLYEVWLRLSDRVEAADTKNPVVRHEKSGASPKIPHRVSKIPTEIRRRGRPKSLQPLTNAERSKRHREKKRVGFFVTRPGYDKDTPLHELKKNTALQVETAPHDGASKPEPIDAGLTPKQRRRYWWVQATLSYGWSALPVHQAAELTNALPDQLVIEWICKRAQIPSWAKHSLEALHARRQVARAHSNDPARVALLLPTDGEEEDAA